MNSEYTFFWNGPFSQWYPSKFVIDGIEFNCAEQYMMYRKALLFNNGDLVQKIMESDSPRDQKAFGRKVVGFNPQTWDAVSRDVVLRGNLAKFTQNPDLQQFLFETPGTTFVEASPYDKVWGIGLGELEAAKTPPDQWKGTNYLGLVITEVRDALLSK